MYLIGVVLAQLQYIFLSDLNFGSPDGLFSAKTQSRKLADGEMINAFTMSLRKTVLEMNLNSSPQIVLLGNTFDFTSDCEKIALKDFSEFVEGLFPTEQTFCFSPEILLVPGDSDQKIVELMNWEKRLSIRDGKESQESVDGEEWEFLNRFVRQNTKLAKLKITIADNLLNLNCMASPTLVFATHGFYMDPVYNIFEKFLLRYQGSEDREVTSKVSSAVRQWVELINRLKKKDLFGSGEEDFADLVGSPWKLRKKSIMLQSVLRDYLSSSNPVGGLKEIKLLSNKISAVLIDTFFIRPIHERKKDQWDKLSKREERTLRGYLEKIKPDYTHASKMPPVFLYGYTGKPFEGILFFDNDPMRSIECWRVYNLGSWKVTKNSSDYSGASAVFIDDAGHSSALKIFSMQSPFDNYQPQVQTSMGEENKLSISLRDSVAQSKSHWLSFSKLLSIKLNEEGKL